MPKRKNAVKRIRVDKKLHLHNVKIKQEIKKAIKKFRALVAGKKFEDAKKDLGKIFSLLDKAAKKNIIHPKTANRKKSRLAQRTSETA